MNRLLDRMILILWSLLQSYLFWTMLLIAVLVWAAQMFMAWVARRESRSQRG